MTKFGPLLVMTCVFSAAVAACDTPHKPPMTPDSEQQLADLDASAELIETAESLADAGAK